MKKYIFLTVIIFIGIILRFWDLGQIPPGVSHDEAAIGYNAYSILTTGKDEYGNPWPIFFRSFDDSKLPGMIYSVAISEKIFGLNEFGVRFPSAFLGVLTIIAFYFLLKELFRNTNLKLEIKNWKLEIPEVAALLLAISPWHINFSRAAFETNGSLFFIVLSILLLVKTFKNPSFFIASVMSAVISFYFYYTSRILIPIVFLVFFLIYKDRFLKIKKWVTAGIILGVIFSIPILFNILNPVGLTRVNTVSILEDKSYTNPYSQAILRNNNSLLSKIIYNRRIAYLQQFSENYLKNLAPDFYFATGTGPMGLMYLWEAPLVLLGIYFLFRIKEKWKWIFIAWFFAVPIVGGLTTQQPNPFRTLPNVPVVVLFSAMGIYYLYNILKKNRFFKFYLSLFVIVFIFFFIRFLVLYFDYQPYHTSLVWGDGHKQMAQFVKENKSKYDNIYVTGYFWRPYIYMLFYLKYQPSLYQKSGSIDGFENIHFGISQWDRGEGINFATSDLSSYIKGNTIFILSSEDFNSQNNLIQSEKRQYKFEVLKKIDGVYSKSVYYIVKLIS
ncbi:MAG: glycosyltransferase family 39 protein [Candidatus Levybacteria bacterium]|nr:glycosyltransferase family 39 protein [Candidatus Levybacteria bacterium]